MDKTGVINSDHSIAKLKPKGERIMATKKPVKRMATKKGHAQVAATCFF